MEITDDVLDWYNGLPPLIKEAVKDHPPTNMYSLNGKQCYILSFDEPESGKLEDITVTVQKTGVGSMFPSLNTNQVFEVKLSDLKPWE